jgi:peptidoglycan/LPS O-acetylase OafA/YrhL
MTQTLQPVEARVAAPPADIQIIDTPAPARRHLPHVRALDGLRGLAVLAVVVYHLDPDVLPGGFLGVSLFFTLSGFLIANLLVGEWRSTGRIGLGDFWARRFRRLLPAALLGLVIAAVTAWWWADASQLAELRADVVAALAYVANWRFVVDGDLYGAGYEQPSPVLHYWSLAIEEQFYVVVALIAVVLARFARSRRTWFVVFGSLAALSMLATVLLWGSADTNRIYFGSDTRAFELLAGVLLALVIGFAVPARARRWAARHVIACVVAGAVVLSFVLVDTGQGWLYRGGFWLVALGSVALIVAALDDGPVARALAWKPLAALGLISYGVYIIHWPIFTFLTTDTIGLDGLALAAVRLAVTFGLAIASYHLLEQPIRTGRWHLRLGPALGAVAAATLALVLATSLLGRHAATRDVVATPDLALSTTELASATAAVEPVAPAPAPPIRRVLFLGDSLVHQSWATLAARMSAAGIEASAIGGEGQHLLGDGGAWLALLEQALAERDPQVVVLEACCGWGTPWRAEQVVTPSGDVLQPDTDESWREWSRMAATVTDLVRAQGRVAVWVLAPPAQTNGYYGPIEGRIAVANGIYQQLARCRPGVGLVDWRALSGPDGSFVAELPDRSGNLVPVRHVDGLHFTPEGQAVVADLTVEAVRAQWRSFGGRAAPPATCAP